VYVFFAEAFGLFFAENMGEEVPRSLSRSFSRLGNSITTLARVRFFLLLV